MSTCAGPSGARGSTPTHSRRPDREGGNGHVTRVWNALSLDTHDRVLGPGRPREMKSNRDQMPSSTLFRIGGRWIGLGAFCRGTMHSSVARRPPFAYKASMHRIGSQADPHLPESSSDTLHS